MQVKFVSVNIWDGGRLFDKLLGFLGKENPDIVAMQEVYDGTDLVLEARFRSMQVLAKELGFLHQAFSPAVLDSTSGSKIPQGNAVLSKFPLEGVETISYDVEFQEWDLAKEQAGNFEYKPRNLQHVVMNVNGTILNLFNTQGIWGRDGADNARRLAMGATIVNATQDKQNVILAGDFNVQEKTKTIGQIEEHLKNVFKNELESTFNMRHKDDPGFATAVVDMIFVSPHIKIVEHYCPNVDVSDHLPLVCLIEI